MATAAVLCSISASVISASVCQGCKAASWHRESARQPQARCADCTKYNLQTPASLLAALGAWDARVLLARCGRR